TITDIAGGARGGFRRSRRRRRPSGAPPALPRSIGTTGKVWLLACAVLLLWLAILLNANWARRLTEQVYAALLREAARLRVEWLTRIMSGIWRVGWGWAVTVTAVALIVSLIVLKRWRHLFTFLGSFAALEFVGSILYNHFRRPRPYDVTIIGRWAGFTIPAPP